MRIAAFVTIAALGWACATTPDPTEQEFLLEHQSSYIDTPTGSGTGFAISPTEVITAWHVVSDVPAQSVTVDGITVETATQIGELDAALLTFAEPHGLKIWSLRNFDAQPAEVIYISGWGVGVHWWSSGFGTVDSDRLSIAIAPGDSGSPVFDIRGDVVGIAVARGYYGEHHCFIVPVSHWLPSVETPA